MNPEQITIAGLLIAALVAGARGLWVFGFIYRAMESERDFWRDHALGSTGLAAMATDMAEAEKRRVDE